MYDENLSTLFVCLFVLFLNDERSPGTSQPKDFGYREQLGQLQMLRSRLWEGQLGTDRVGSSF